jgi:hypothetical protein
MDMLFKKAVCDAFHGVSDEDILESGFLGDIKEVNLHALELAERFAATEYGLLEVYDFVYAWSINDEVKFPWDI